MLYGEGYDGAGLGALLAAATEAQPAPTGRGATDDTTGVAQATPRSNQADLKRCSPVAAHRAHQAGARS